MAARKTSPAPKKPAAAKRPAKKKAAPPPAPRTEDKPAATPPSELGVRGRRLWVALHEHIDGEGVLVLLEEACRIADRLDKLDALLQGDADVWCRLVLDLRTETYELRIDSALIEARQQANVLRQLVAALPLKKEPAGDGEEGDWTEGL